MEDSLWIVSCRFKEHQDGHWQRGIAIGTVPGWSNIVTILDNKGVPIEEPWDYELRPIELSVIHSF